MGNQFFGPDRKATATERPRVQRRLDRLEAMTAATSKATKALADLPGADALERVRIRNGFVYASRPATDVSDRKVPPRGQRPPATRLMASTGSALRLLLIALFEAQTRMRSGSAHRNPRPITSSESDTPSWTDLLTTPAVDSTEGDWMIRAEEKRVRSIRSALLALEAEELVWLPNANQTRGVLEGFRLLRENGRRASGDNPRYKIPTDTSAFFTIPATLFTRGWIHVLQDTELAFLLIICYHQHSHDPGEKFRIKTDIRLRRHGLGRDAYSDSARLLSELGLIDVETDPHQHDDGKVAGYGNRRFSLPNAFQLLPAGFDKDADLALLQHLRHLLR